MSAEKRIYTAPKVTRYQSIDTFPTHLRPLLTEILRDKPVLKLTVDENRRNVSVSEELALLLGYTARELVGKPIDEITADDTVDLDFVFRLSRRLGEMKGLWLFESRQGRKLLCKYSARRCDSEIEAEFIPLLIAA
jgi:PAS domain S-box-containing protein